MHLVMIDELKKSIREGNVFFGAKENIKNLKNIQRIVLPSDAREETIRMLKEKEMNIDFLEISRKEASQKLELDFLCEVFGLGK